MAEEQEVFVERDYVYCGERLAANDNDRFISIQIIGADGKLEKQQVYKYSRKMVGTIGGIYTAQFSDAGTSRGIGNGKYKGQWPNKEDRIYWQSQEEQAEMRLKLKRMEADAGRISDLELALVDARKLYEKLRSAYDSAGCRALDQAVLAALHTPLRKIEED